MSFVFNSPLFGFRCSFYIYIYSLSDNGKRQVKLGAVPTINLPIKSQEREKTAEKRHINIVKDTVPNSKHKDAYKNIDHFAKCFKA